MKKRLIYYLVTLILSVCSLTVNAQTKEIIPLPDIKNLHMVDSGVYRSGQPNKEEFHLLEKADIGEILNLRRFHSDNKKAKETNLKLHHIKIRAEAINETHLLQALKIIKDRQVPILIHCHHGSDRTGAVVAMYRIVFQGWTKEEAIDEMKNGGYGFHGIYRNIPRLIEKIDIESFKEELYKY